MAHSNEDLIRDLYEVRERGDLEAVRTILADDIVWREPDLDNPHTGDLRGPEAVLGMIREAQRITGDTFSLVPREVVSHGGQVVAFIDWSAERDGGQIEGKEIAVYRVRDGKIVVAFFHVDDPTDDREFWK